jgi:hypothetical protein
MREHAMKFSTIVTGPLLALALLGPASAQTLLTGADTAEVLNAARGYGAANLTTQSNGDPQITGKIEGVTYQVYFLNCTNNANCEDINFYLGFMDIKPSLESINDWNVSKRFTRAYVDQDRDACLEMDLDLVRGVTAEYLDAQFELWAMSVKQYASHVGYR